MEYKKYQHIEKIDSKEVEGILNGKCYVYPKIDGMNTCIFLKDDGKIGYGTRKREIDLGCDVREFVERMMKVESELKAYFSENPSHIIYGEYLVPHTLRTYSKDSWDKFYAFDVFDCNEFKYIDQTIWESEFKRLCPSINVIPSIAILDTPTKDDLIALLDKSGTFLCTEGLGEGIVIKNYDYKNPFGRITWAKILTEDFKQRKVKLKLKKSENKEESQIEDRIANILTPEYIQKEYGKLVDKYGTWQNKYFLELINNVFYEFLRDNMLIIVKKYKNPVINFALLRKLIEYKIKEIILP